MCAWLGEPDAVEFRKNSIRAALEVVRSIEEFSASDPEVTLNARIGLQDGPFYLGHTGGGGRMSYSILGNPANAASRLEGLNKKLGTKILASGSVVTGLDDFATRPLGHFMVVGKSEMAEVVEIIGLTQEIDMPTRQLIDGFTDALTEFLQERWEPARERFEELVAQFPKDGASRFYLGICQRYLAEGAPADQPSVLAMTEK
jgi:adenylate cyclase